jgi:hypothetical protein
MILTLEAFAGESKISEFDGGKVTVTVPFEVPAGKTGDQFYVAYIAADGTMTVMPTVYADGKLSFETTHFSDYAILEKTTSDDNSGSVPPSGGEPATGGNGNLIPLIVLVLLSAAGMAVCVWKRRAF